MLGRGQDGDCRRALPRVPQATGKDNGLQHLAPPQGVFALLPGVGPCLFPQPSWSRQPPCTPAGPRVHPAQAHTPGPLLAGRAQASLQVLPRAPARTRPSPQHPAQMWGSCGSMNPKLHVRLGVASGAGDTGGGAARAHERTPGKGSYPSPGPVGSVGRGRGGGVEHTVAKSGLTGFSNRETSLRMARVPDVLSKTRSLGSPWDGYSSKSAWPSLALCGGLAPCFGKLHNPGQCPAAPSAAAQPSSVPQPPPPGSS